MKSRELYSSVIYGAFLALTIGALSIGIAGCSGGRCTLAVCGGNNCGLLPDGVTCAVPGLQGAGSPICTTTTASTNPTPPFAGGACGCFQQRIGLDNPRNNGCPCKG